MGIYGNYFDLERLNMLVNKIMKVLSNLFGLNKKINASDVAVKDLNNKAKILNDCVIVDSGTNSNGSWIKYGNGIMICTKRVKFSTTIENRWGNLFDSEKLSLGNFPQPFVSKPIMSATNCYASGEESRGAMIEAIFNVTGTSAGVCWICRGQIETVAKQYIFDIMAIGRWK